MAGTRDSFACSRSQQPSIVSDAPNPKGYGAAAVLALVNVLPGLVFGWIAIGSNTAAGLLWPCMYNNTDAVVDSALQTAINIGAAAGSMGGGKIYERWGFKKTLLLGGALSLFVVWTMFARTYAQQFVARTLCGLGIGVLSSCGPQYVSDAGAYYFSKSNTRTGDLTGKLGVLFQLSITLGIVLSNIAAYFLLGAHRDDGLTGSGSKGDLGSPEDAGAGYTKGFCDEYGDHDWYFRRNVVLFLPGAVLCVCTMILAVLIDENPLWVHKRLDGKGADEEAAPMLPDGGAGAEPTPMRVWVMGVMGCVALQLTGINAVMFYAGSFFDAANFSQKILGSVLVMCWNFLSTVLAISLIDRYGRRGLMLTGLAMITVSITLLTPMDEWVTNDSVKSALCFVCLAVYILGFELGPGCLFWVYLPELSPPGSPILPFANALQWAFTCGVTFAFPPLQQKMSGYVFWIFAGFAWVSLIFHWRALPETSGKRNQQAAQQMLKGGPWSAGAAAAIAAEGPVEGNDNK